MGEQVAQLVNGAALDSHSRGHSALPAPFRDPGVAPSTTTSSGVGNPRRTRSSSSARQAASPSPPMLLIASIFLANARAHRRVRSATRSRSPSLSSRTRATVPSRISRTIGCSASERAFQASQSPFVLRPDAADHVLADRLGRQTPRSTRGARGGCWSLQDKPRRSRRQRLGCGAGKSAQRTAPAIARSVLPSSPVNRAGAARAIRAPCQTCPSAQSARDARGARQQPMAPPSSSTWLAPAVARTADNASESSSSSIVSIKPLMRPSPNPVLDRVEPIIQKQSFGGHSRLLRGILRHGVGLRSSAPTPESFGLNSLPGDYAYAYPIPTTSATGPVVSLGGFSRVPAAGRVPEPESTCPNLPTR